MKIFKSIALFVLVLLSLIFYIKYNLKLDLDTIESTQSILKSKLLLAGKLPYLDFKLYQAPLYLVLLALFIKKLGVIYGLIILHISINTLISYLLYRLSKRLILEHKILNLLIFVLSFCFLFKFLPFFYDNPINLFWLFSIITILYFFRYVERAEKKYLIYTSFFLTLVVLTKHDSLLYFYGFIFQAVLFHELSLKETNIPLLKRLISSFRHPLYLVGFTLLFASPFLIVLFYKVPFEVLKFNLYEMSILKFKEFNNVNFPSFVNSGLYNFKAIILNSNSLLFYLPLLVYFYGLVYIVMRYRNGLLPLSSYTFWLEMTTINLGMNLFTPAWVVSRAEMVIPSVVIGFVLTIYYILSFKEKDII